MKILLAGNWRWSQYEESLYDGLISHDVVCKKFSYDTYLSDVSHFPVEAIPCGISAVRRLNQALIEKAVTERVNVVFLWAPRHICPSTVKALRREGIRTVSYQNDDPFQEGRSLFEKFRIFLFWRLYLGCIPHFDLSLYYRDINVREANRRGSPYSKVWLPFYNPSLHKKVVLNQTEKKKYASDVVFIGHFENDGRDSLIEHLLYNGIDVKVWGDSTWNNSSLANNHRELFPITPALGDEYCKALSGAKIALCFLSKQNRDEYTRRCFEIPACSTLLISERTPYLESLFAEDVSAVFFDSKTDLLMKVKHLLADDQVREEIASNGRKLVERSGFSIKDRAEELLLLVRKNLNPLGDLDGASK